MTNIWLLSKQSMKGMDLLEVATDVLYVLEQQELKPLEEGDLRQRLHKGQDLLQRLAFAAKAQISQTGQKDLFMLRVAEGLEKNLGLPPSELVEKLERSFLELEKGFVSADTINVFEHVSDIVMKLTSRSVDAISISLH